MREASYSSMIQHNIQDLLRESSRIAFVLNHRDVLVRYPLLQTCSISCYLAINQGLMSCVLYLNASGMKQSVTVSNHIIVCLAAKHVLQEFLQKADSHRQSTPSPS